MARRLRVSSGGSCITSGTAVWDGRSYFRKRPDYAAFQKVLSEARQASGMRLLSQARWVVRTAAKLRLESSLRAPWRPKGRKDGDVDFCK